ncbi:hypothetical protein HOA55_00935 [archaeon]|jgi:hypothetical protein|nr:hypothetical protein [archaeon]MBT3577634.1 hypothetical protein [archaeon]MBT6819900.1 hypothetical protein [archaeon]MBT6956690.1 hypothetical protein [archaeon]MBT7025056.1 hypothetical protein [archaeon]
MEDPDFSVNYAYTPMYGFLNNLKLYADCHHEEFIEYLHGERGWDLEEDGSWNKILDSYFFEDVADYTHLWRKSPKFLKDILDFGIRHWGVFLGIMKEREGLVGSEVMGKMKKIYDDIRVDPWWVRRKTPEGKRELYGDRVSWAGSYKN